MLQQNVFVIITWLPVIFILSKTYFPYFEKYFKLYNVTFKNILLFLVMYPVHKCMYVQYMSGHGDQKRVIRSPGVGVIKACEPHYIRRWKQRGVLCRVSVIL